MLGLELQMVGDKLSNDEFDGLPDPKKFVDEALEALREAWMRHLSPSQEKGFRLRMSNVGKPLCQLQMAASGATPKRKPYNFKAQMMIGDAVEAIMNIYLGLASVNMTGCNDEVELEVDGTAIKGTYDVEIENKIYDVKSCSPWAFDNKWSYGYEGLRDSDDFGYIGQLTGYANAKGKDVGGWLVMNKSDGRMKVVEADITENEKKANLFGIQFNVTAVKDNHPFKRKFEPIVDTFRGKRTGLKRLCKTCEFCDYMSSCWPSAKYMAHPKSEAKKPPMHWFVEDE